MKRVDLRAGDTLLYAPSSFWSYLIAIKTFNKVSHCECYVGQGQSVASRDGQGVNLYPLRENGLTFVLRPNQPFDLDEALAWFTTVKGQQYDWKGLLRFFTWGKVGGIDTQNKQFCSEMLCRLYRAGGLDPFNGCDADSVSPAQFLYSSCFTKSVYAE